MIYLKVVQLMVVISDARDFKDGYIINISSICCIVSYCLIIRFVHLKLGWSYAVLRSYYNRVVSFIMNKCEKKIFKKVKFISELNDIYLFIFVISINSTAYPCVSRTCKFIQGLIHGIYVFPDVFRSNVFLFLN